MTEVVDVIIIGGGIAGASAAAYLAGELRVVVVEREAQPGYHSTGRSAAVFSEIYGNASVRALSRASRTFLFSPPDGFTETALVKPRGWLVVATAEQQATLETFASSPDIVAHAHVVSKERALELCPALSPDYVAAGAFEPDAVDVDVNALHRGFLRRLKGNDGRLLVNAEVLRGEYSSGRWLIETTQGTFAAPAVVNASGGWADQTAERCGVARIGITPYQRTAVVIDAPGGEPERWPLVFDVDEQFYFKPDAGRLVVSPADETPVTPYDAQPEEIDIATAVARFEAVTGANVQRLHSKWAGLRSFAPDRSLAIGEDPLWRGFFWLAGQGGYGVQTSPAAGQLAAALVQGVPMPARLRDAGLILGDVEARRLRPKPYAPAAIEPALSAEKE